MSSRRLETHLNGSATEAVRAFYDLLPRIPKAAWPEMLHGMGYNFEFYDGLFPMMLANVQLSMEGGDYTPRYQAVQAGLLPYCSEFGVELDQPMLQSHRQLYAQFYQTAVGSPHPERYPADAENAWVAISRRWTRTMTERVRCPERDPVDRARFNIAYLWAVEYLSIFEFTTKRQAWQGVGVAAEYLNAHYEVEGEHNAHAARAVLAFAEPDHPTVVSAITAHESDLGGFYKDARALALIVISGRPSAARAV